MTAMPTEQSRSGRSHRRTTALRWATFLLALALIAAGSLALAGRLTGVGPGRHSDNHSGRQAESSSAKGHGTASNSPPGYSPEQTAAHPLLTSPVDYDHDSVDDYMAMVSEPIRRHSAILVMTAATIRVAIRPMTEAPAPTGSGGPFGRPAMI